jgi:hypothetical protein
LQLFLYRAKGNIMSFNIKEMVKNGKQVRFVRYRKGRLYYETECGFEFPVPVDDTGDGIFKAKDKAMMFMRYIRKHIKDIDVEKAKETA